jgi:hypothetical protein
MKISKPKSSLRRPRFPLACTARQEHRDAVCSLIEPEEEDMSTIHEPECAEEADEDEEDGNGEKQNEGKEDRERARRIENVQGGRNWDDDEVAQCLSRPLGGAIPFQVVMVCIQSGRILY